MEQQRTVFNAAQLELLKAMSSLQTDEDLKELKHALSEFFAQRAEKELQRLWENGAFDQKKLDELRGMHLRTPYQQ